MTPLPDDDRDDPLAPDECAVLRLWADAQPATAVVSVYSLQRALATTVQIRRALREARASESAAWGLLAADLTDSPPSSGIR